MKTKRFQTKNINDKNQQGAALVVSIFAILLVTIIGFAVISNGMVSQTIAKNSKEQTEAYYMAEAGLAHAVQLFKANGNSFDVNTVIPASGNGLAFGVGSYTVQTQYDSSTNVRRITSIGTGKNGAVATIEGSYQAGAPSSPAVLANGNVSISSNLQVTGTNGIVHINGTLSLNGNMRAQRYFSSTSTITKSGVQSCPSGAVTGAPPTCDPVADTRQSQSAITVPDIQPSSFYSQADYFLVPPNPGSMPTPLSAKTPPTTATIYDKNGNILANNCQAGCWGNWSYNSTDGFTAVSGTTFPAGVYYAYKSSIKARFASFGSSGSQLSVSFIADGHILLDDSTFYFDAKATMGGEKYFVVAGGDILIDDADLYNTDTNQIFYARNQFYLGDSDAHLYGKVRVLNAADTSLFGTNLVTGQSFQVTGPQPIVSNGPSSGGSAFALVSWREVRY